MLADRDSSSVSDLAQHVRTVHFSLVVASAVCLLATTAQRGDFDRAALQDAIRIQRAAEIVSDSFWFSRIAIQTIAGPSAHGRPKWQVRLVLPSDVPDDPLSRRIVDPRVIDAFSRSLIHGRSGDTGSDIRSVAGLNWNAVVLELDSLGYHVAEPDTSIHSTLSRNGISTTVFKRPRTLVEWRRIWNSLESTGICHAKLGDSARVSIPEVNALRDSMLTPDPSDSANAVLWRDTTVALKQNRDDTRRIVIDGKLVQEYQWRSDPAGVPRSVIRDSVVVGHSIFQVQVPSYHFESRSDTLWARLRPNPPQNERWVSHHPFPRIQAQVRCSWYPTNPRASLAKEIEADWSDNEFNDAFRELRVAAGGLGNLPLEELEDRLRERVGEYKNISVLGFDMPLTELGRWGTVLLVAIQLYFWLHLRTLHHRLQQSGTSFCEVAWIGLYLDRASRATTLVSCTLLPLSSILALGALLFSGAGPGTVDPSATVVFAIGIGLELVLLACIDYSIWHLWRLQDKNRIQRQPRSPPL